jgi:integrase
MKGDGWVYLKQGAGRQPRWYLGYYRDGREHREPAWVPDAKAPQGRRPAASEEEASRILRATVRALDRGELVTPEKRRLTVGELLDALVTWMSNQGRRSADKMVSHLKPVRAFFGHMRAVAVTSALVERYKAERLRTGKARATVNRELEGLRRAYSWGAKQKPPLVADVLSVEFFREDNARQGFFERADFEALLAHVKDTDLRDFIEWGFWTGMRAGEISKLTWAMLDRETWTLRLHASAAKTGKGRVLVLGGPLLTIIERRLQARRLDSPLIFHRMAKGLPGQPVKDFRHAWAAACKAVGLPAGRASGFTFHDLRRTAVRNLIRAGVDQAVAMRISGHETTSTFRRYNITSEDDLRSAVERVAAYVGKLPAERKVVGMSEGRK